MPDLAGKVALVTGAASGIGRETAGRLVEAGATVVGGDLRADGVPGAFTVALDVADGESVAAAVREAAERAGGLDLVVNCSGIFVHDSSEASWERTLAINLTGTMLVTRAAWPHLAGSGGGAVVNLASTAALQGAEGYAAYCTSKAGVAMLTKCLALEGARDGIRVNCVCPGTIDTPMMERYFAAQDDPAASRRGWEAATPLGRMGTPTDIAGAILYLLSPAAAWVTGTALVVDGGLMSGVRA